VLTPIDPLICTSIYIWHACCVACPSLPWLCRLHIYPRSYFFFRSNCRPTILTLLGLYISMHSDVRAYSMHSDVRTYSIYIYVVHSKIIVFFLEKIKMTCNLGRKEQHNELGVPIYTLCINSCLIALLARRSIHLLLNRSKRPMSRVRLN
jgi:hypothetical protein